MARKPFTLRQAVMTGAALAAGSTVGPLAETIVTRYDLSHVGIAPLAAVITALWVLDKLNALVDDTE